MKVLVLGGGGREHALAWALRRSAAVSEVYCAPGNAGIEGAATCLPLSPNKPAEILRFLNEKEIGLTVIGPEAPLVDGLADALRAGGRLVFGPNAAAARLEGSKILAKEFMRAHGLPTADFRVFVNAGDALSFVRSAEWKDTFRVVKADGLAAGKGVVVAQDRAEVLAAVESMMVDRAHGAAGERILIEELLTGEELSVMALTDGKTLLPLLPTQDHKRVFDNDQGPNTGGMGAYGPVPQVGADLWRSIEKEVFDRFLAGIAAEALDYRGVIYFGLMLTPDGPRVLEFNVRFGDPETQVILPMGKGDWLPLFLATAEGNLAGKKFKAHPGAAVTVVLASGGYPGKFEKGKVISGLDDVENDNVTVFHAGTARDARGRVVTAGGRVLTVTARGADLTAARQATYAAVGKIKFDGAHFRTDIGARALAALAKS
ncbi:MAG: phosphoribosylamine--glycine ligase [Elusimicrobia bacterium]|jgi:phosphoribosylamine--glycine ligase|nr:phosphoribosylamine--glycine ligase [Elusimicrobiota bacterium]MBK7544507.1 phosphoribosylamine--glycine ligase [Elusimicrobiota bacterium]MBK7574030.1 phosphoribosylamine--glycine ligase [Elusimicrobiota bacterium]MBK7689021.1 phosphoribosylamine--glycine ligase [Elusimicrobiota bacterium]MBK8126170.1 phosphoribosylamine--glycine ligase [Elusimicrobiota bacterium]